MADGFQRLVSVVRNTYPELRAAADSRWGATNRDHRNVIRQAVAADLPNLGADQQGQLMKLGGRPQPAGWSLSISHTPEMGGWMALPLPTHIGFDVETGSRVQPKVIERVCSRLEIAEAPKLTFLWAAKEACYKSLPPELQPNTFGALTIREWSQAGPGIYAFAASTPGQGWVSDDGLLIYAAFGN